MVAVHDADFGFGDFKMLRYELEDAGVCLITLGFFVDGNFKMIFGLFYKRFFLCTGFDFHVNVGQFILIQLPCALRIAIL